MVALAPLAYLVAAICFIMALRGLSSPETSRQGNNYGIAGMVIAIVTTLMLPDLISGLSLTLIVVGIAIGGAIGAVTARKIEMTALPQLVAAFHSLVGLAAVFVAIAAFYAPVAYGIGTSGNIRVGSLIEMALGVAIGAITFTGSLVAFAKLQGLVSGKPLVFNGQHMLNAGLGVVLLLAIIWLCTTNAPAGLGIIVLLALALAFLLSLPIGGADMPVVVSMLN